MPGVIVEVSVAVGVRVDRGDVVVVLDAMKMNNAIRAPRDGTVAEIFVDVGHPVAHGDPLVRFEAD
jgi:biotin carboxyl carrier protein